jgi:hypothetical protein
MAWQYFSIEKRRFSILPYGLPDALCRLKCTCSAGLRGPDVLINCLIREEGTCTVQGSNLQVVLFTPSDPGQDDEIILNTGRVVGSR